MKLYFSPGACSLAVRIVIHEIGLSSDFEAVDLKNKVTETGVNFLTVNPKGGVPVLVTNDGKILTENAVIQQFLADTNHAMTLLPPLGDFSRYKVLEWLNFVSTDLHKGFGPLFNPNVSENEKEKVFKPILKSKFDFVDNQLQQKKFLMGDTFTLPDAYLFVMILWSFHFKFDLSSLKNLSRYFANLKNRQAIQQALLEEGLQ